MRVLSIIQAYIGYALNKKQNIITRERNIKVREFVNFMKELFMLKQNNARVGLSSFRKAPEPIREVIRPKATKEVKLSDLMRRANA